MCLSPAGSSIPQTQRPCLRSCIRIVVLATLLLTSSASLQTQDLHFSWPVAAEHGVDVVLVNHVDHDTASNSIRNYNCKVYTYDGHEGTDFVLRSFRQMDSGVAVLAAAGGRVVTVIDTMYDRNKQSVKERGFGNYIAIQHAEGYTSYYVHIRTHSAMVAVGDMVDRGQPIALVGSSGNSSDPHLHFEVWRRVDPFAGNCGDRASLWDQQVDISGEHTVLDHDVTAWPPLLDTIRERPPHLGTIDTSVHTITAWSLHTGVEKSDEFTVAWYAPDGSKWFSYTAPAELTTNYMYWWSFIDYSKGTMKPGTWNVKTIVKGTVVCTDTFYLPTPTIVNGTTAPARRTFAALTNVQLYQTDGTEVHGSINDLADGVYGLRSAEYVNPILITVRNGVVFGVGNSVNNTYR